MITNLRNETPRELEKRLVLELRELRREIGALNYMRAAGIATYIRDQLVTHVESRQNEQT